MPVWHLASGYRYAIFFDVLQWIAACGRVIVRGYYVKKFGWDDVALVVTLVISTAYDAILIAIVYTTNGGVRADHVPPGHLVPAINLTLSSFVTYIAASTTLKIACGLLLLRVLVRRWQVWTIYAVMAVSTTYGIVFFFVTLLQCGDPSQFHVKMLFGDRCLSADAIDGTTYTHSVIVTVTDFIFAVLPIALIWNTKMPRRSKLSVAAILSLGSVAVVATLARFAYIHDLTKPSIDFLHTSQPIALLASLELCVGVTAISICTYKPFFKRFYRADDYQSFTSANGGRQQRLWPEQSAKSRRGGRRAPENTEVTMATWKSRETDLESDMTSLTSPMKSPVKSQVRSPVRSPVMAPQQTPQTFADALHSHPSRHNNNRNTI